MLSSVLPLSVLLLLSCCGRWFSPPISPAALRVSFFHLTPTYTYTLSTGSTALLVFLLARRLFTLRPFILALF